MPQPRRTLLCAAVLAVCTLPSACTSPPTAPGTRSPVLDVSVRDTAALFQTDALAYTLRREPAAAGYTGVLQVRFTNRTGGPVYFVNCGGVPAARLEKRVSGRWVPAWSPVVLLCLSPPVTVRAGATYDTQIRVFDGRPSNSLPQFTVDKIPGVYRAVWAPLQSYDTRQPSFGEPIPLEQRVSNQFVLAVAPR